MKIEISQFNILGVIDSVSKFGFLLIMITLLVVNSRRFCVSTMEEDEEMMKHVCKFCRKRSVKVELY